MTVWYNWKFQEIFCQPFFEAFRHFNPSLFINNFNGKDLFSMDLSKYGNICLVIQPYSRRGGAVQHPPTVNKPLDPKNGLQMTPNFEGVVLNPPCHVPLNILLIFSTPSQIGLRFLFCKYLYIYNNFIWVRIEPIQL